MFALQCCDFFDLSGKNGIPLSSNVPVVPLARWCWFPQSFYSKMNDLCQYWWGSLMIWMHFQWFPVLLARHGGAKLTAGTVGHNSLIGHDLSQGTFRILMQEFKSRAWLIGFSEWFQNVVENQGRFAFHIFMSLPGPIWKCSVWIAFSYSWVERVGLKESCLSVLSLPLGPVETSMRRYRTYLVSVVISNWLLCLWHGGSPQ